MARRTTRSTRKLQLSTPTLTTYLSTIKLPKMGNFRLLFFAVLLTSSAFMTESRAKKTHPGCIVWWFLPGCPFAYVFGPDPLRFYPWNKFCVEYSAFDNTEFCPNKSLETGTTKEEQGIKDVEEDEEETRQPRIQ